MSIKTVFCIPYTVFRRRDKNHPRFGMEPWKFLLISAGIHIGFLLLLKGGFTGRTKLEFIEVSLVRLSPKSTQEKVAVQEVVREVEPTDERKDEVLPEPEKEIPLISEEVAEPIVVKEEIFPRREEPVADEEPSALPSFHSRLRSGYGNVFPVTDRDKIYMAYLDLVQRKIESQRKYPRRAVKGEIEGTSYVKFTILPNGDVGEIEVVSSSGFRILDRAAVAMVKKASPFPSLPQASPLDIKLPIKFKINQ